jgi:hypothetical protein
MTAEVESSTQWKPKSNPWLIAATVALAAFMEVLDTSIANVALPHIAGDLGASTSQGTWVLTSYLVSNAIILPVGAWASSVIGRRNFFLLCITIFTVASFPTPRIAEYIRSIISFEGLILSVITSPPERHTGGVNQESQGEQLHGQTESALNRPPAGKPFIDGSGLLKGKSFGNEIESGPKTGGNVDSHSDQKPQPDVRQTPCKGQRTNQHKLEKDMGRQPESPPVTPPRLGWIKSGRFGQEGSSTRCSYIPPPNTAERIRIAATIEPSIADMENPPLLFLS